MATPSKSWAGGDYAAAFEAGIDRLAGSRLASLGLVLVVALACFLPGFAGLPVLDGDEPAYAVAARAMAATGDLVGSHVQTDTQPWRPHGAQWLAAAVVALGGNTTDPPMWLYRLPSLVGGVAVALLTWWLALAFGRPRAALLAGLLVAGSGLLGLEARQVGPDAALAAVTTLAAGALARLWLARDDSASRSLSLWLWAAIGAGILLKGAIAPAMAGAAVLVLSVDRRSFGWLARLRPGPGVAVLIVIVLPWLASVAALAVSDSSGPDMDFLTRIGVPFHLEAPPGTYALLAPLLVGPAMTFLFLALPWLVDNVGRPAILFALAWGAPLWIAAELVPEKLPQYVLPVVPFLALMAGTAIDAGVTQVRGKVSLIYSAGPLIWPPAIAVVLPFAFLMLEGHFPFAAFAVLVVAAVLGPVAWLWLRRGKAVAAAALSVVTVVFIYLGFFGIIVPGIVELRVAERIVATGTDRAPCANPMFSVAGFPEESVVLAAGPRTELTDGFGAADFLDEAGCRIAAVDTSQISSFRQRADDLGVEPVERGRVVGFNLRKMRRVEIHLFSAAAAGG